MREHEFRRVISTFAISERSKIRVLVITCSSCPGTRFIASMDTRKGPAGARLMVRNWELRHRGVRL